MPDVDDPLVPEIAQKYIEDYEGYVKNAKSYTERFATAIRPPDDDLFFPEKEEFDQSPAPPRTITSSPNTSAASYIGSMDTASETAFTSPGASLTSDQTISAIPTINPLIEHISEPSVSRKWSLFKPKSDVDHVRSNDDLVALVRKTRLRMGSQLPLANEPTELDIEFALLEKALQFLAASNTHSGSDQSLRACYSSLRRHCIDHFHTCLKVRPVNIQKHNYKCARLFELSVDSALFESWNFTRAVEDVRDVLSTIASRVDTDFQLNEIALWCSEKTDGFPACLVYHHLVEYALNRGLHLHGARLLEVPSVLKFLRPRSTLYTERRPEIASAEDEESMLWCMWCGSLDFQRFIPEVVQPGTNATYVAGRNDLSRRCDDAEVQFNYNSGWHTRGFGLSVAHPDIDSVTSDVKSIEAVTLQRDIWIQKYRLLLRYTSPNLQPLEIVFIFSDIETAEMWLSTMELFQGILRAREKCLLRAPIDAHYSPTLSVVDPEEVKTVTTTYKLFS
ncbi:uncharacterized protein LY89DRAFT_735844 [Mollisia scopiformis]|uniref:Uncharacterized protein n=1 Tax=Mollisia scopiformis TaxID=149040 RepID=A0A194X3J4_MOLSC|nr:uncharacterized protein LY89DRAFT_735844 [Mollisia scopiformis]KUJ14770.1 hypothetical protein LY89DRAFT_735844 [Mollisia scopiformis]